MDESSLLSKMVATFPVLDSWGAELANVYLPERGSELGDDDEDWPVHPVSQIATMGLGSARDHLQALRVHLEVRELFPVAQLSLIRGALLGGAQAVYVLGPDDRAQRVERSRMLAAHMYGEHAKFVTQAMAVADPKPAAAVVAEHLEMRRQQIAAKRAEDGQRSTLNATEMVLQAARMTFTSDHLAQEAVAVWRLTSGAAHGYSWSLLGHGSTRVVSAPDPHGMVTMEAAGGIDRVANNYLCAFYIARQGWRLREMRGTAS